MNLDSLSIFKQVGKLTGLNKSTTYRRMTGGADAMLGTVLICTTPVLGQIMGGLMIANGIKDTIKAEIEEAHYENDDDDD